MSSDYEVIGIASSEPAGHLEKAAESQNARGIPIKMTRKITPLQDLRSLYKLYRVLRREKPFFVHTHTPKAGLIGMLASYFARVPHRLHDIAGLPLVEATGFKRQILVWVEKITYFCATRVYPNSRGLHKIVLENKFAAPDKFKVLDKVSSNGVDTAKFNKEHYKAEELQDLRESLGINQEDFVWVFVGRMVKDKGINELVKAFEILSERNPQLKLLLVGMFEKDLDPLLPETMKSIENNPGIIEAGTQHDVRPYLAISDLLVFPSYREGFPNVPMEAGAMGLPAIVTDINGCNEIIEEGKNGLIFPPKNVEAIVEAAERLLDEPELFQELARNARPMISSRFEQEGIWKEILKEYRALEAQSR